MGRIVEHSKQKNTVTIQINSAIWIKNWLVTNISEKSMPQVKVKDNEPFDVALRRFKRSCEKAGVLTEIRRREAYEKPTTERKRKAAAAVKRNMKKLSKERERLTRNPHRRR